MPTTRVTSAGPKNGRRGTTGIFRNILRWDVDTELLASGVTGADGYIGAIETRLQ
jgi:hypothetical protein